MLLAVLSVVWTPTSEGRYDLCLRSEGTVDPPFCRREAALKWTEGLLLLGFAAEMTARVIVLLSNLDFIVTVSVRPLFSAANIVVLPERVGLVKTWREQ